MAASTIMPTTLIIAITHSEVRQPTPTMSAATAVAAIMPATLPKVAAVDI